MLFVTLSSSRSHRSLRSYASSKPPLAHVADTCYRIKNGGHCQPFVYAQDPRIAAFELETFHFLKAFVAENKIPCDWVAYSGVHAFLTQDLFDLASAAVSELKATHPGLGSQVELVGPSSASPAGAGSSTSTTTSSSTPTLSSLRIPHAKGAVVQKHAASLWPYKLVAWVLEQLISDFPAPRFNLQTNTPVTSLKRRPDGTWLLRTPRGPLVAKTVLLCTNGYTSRLLPAFADLIVPVRGQVAALLPRSREPKEAPARLDHSYVFNGILPGEGGPSVRDEYLVQRPLPTGELVFGGGRNAAENLAVGVWRDDEVEASVAKWLKTHLSPPLELGGGGGGGEDGKQRGEVVAEEELGASFEWTGIMGYSRDHHSWVGAVPESMGGGGPDGGLWICAGYTGHGMPVAPSAARAVVRMMAGEDLASVAGGEGGLPREFALTEDRVAKARENLETVQEWETKGFGSLFPALAGVSPRKD